jgi:hypothetical protein
MANQNLGSRGKIAISLGILASLGFLIAALVIFIREGDWPARYIYAGVAILSVMFLAIRRRVSPRRR